jgi:VWFA-related protein
MKIASILDRPSAALVFLAVVLSPAVTRATAPPNPAPVAESVRVEVVNVEVFVTGKDGKPVFGLDRSQFELLEDGRPVPLTNFLAPIPPAVPAPPVTGEPSHPGVAPPDEVDRDRILVVFIDNFNISVQSRKPVLDRLDAFLADRLRAGYRVLMVGFDRFPRRYAPLTDDPKVVAAVVAKLRREANEGTWMRARRDTILRDMSRGAAAESGDVGDLARQEVLNAIRSLAEEQYTVNRSLLAALTGLVDSLAGLPGRKVVLYVSDGPQVRASEELFAEYDKRFAGGMGMTATKIDFSVSAQLGEVTRRANASRTTFYTINGGAGSGMARISPELQGPSAENLETVDTFNRDESLTAFTAGTGGTKLPHPEALAKLAVELEAFYSLGYSPDHFGDGRYHSLAVRVKHPGVSVRSRDGYLDKTPVQRLADRTTAALLAGANDNPLAVRLSLGTPEKQGRNKLAVPLTVTIPASRLTLLPNGANHEGKVTVAISVASKDGRNSEVHRESFPISVPAQAVQGFLTQDATFTFTLLVQPGDRSVSVSARDETGNLESVVVSQLAPEPAKS